MTNPYDFGLRAYEARLNITWAGQNGDLTDAVPFDASDAELKAMAIEAVNGGSVTGLTPDRNMNLDGFVVDRFQATEGTPYNRIFVRPKTPFGSAIR